MRVSASNPGELRHRVELQERMSTPDGLGGEITSWTTRAFLWAKVTPTRQAGGTTADHLQGLLTHEVHIRYRDGVRAGMRLLHRGRILRLLSCIDADEAQTFLICLCEEEK